MKDVPLYPPQGYHYETPNCQYFLPMIFKPFFISSNLNWDGLQPSIFFDVRCNHHRVMKMIPQIIVNITFLWFFKPLFLFPTIQKRNYFHPNESRVKTLRFYYLLGGHGPRPLTASRSNPWGARLGRYALRVILMTLYHRVGFSLSRALRGKALSKVLPSTTLPLVRLTDSMV